MPETKNTTRSPFTKKELEEFRSLIETKRGKALAEAESCRKRIAALRESRGDDSVFGLHAADASDTATEIEQLHILVDRQQKFIGHLDRALDRIEAGTYGICKVTGKPISKERLRAVPHTETSIEAKLGAK